MDEAIITAGASLVGVGLAGAIAYFLFLRQRRDDRVLDWFERAIRTFHQADSACMRYGNALERGDESVFERSDEFLVAVSASYNVINEAILYAPREAYAIVSELSHRNRTAVEEGESGKPETIRWQAANYRVAARRLAVLGRQHQGIKALPVSSVEANTRWVEGGSS